MKTAFDVADTFGDLSVIDWPLSRLPAAAEQASRINKIRAKMIRG